MSLHSERISEFEFELALWHAYCLGRRHAAGGDSYPETCGDAAELIATQAAADDVQAELGIYSRAQREWRAELATHLAALQAAA